MESPSGSRHARGQVLEQEDCTRKPAMHDQATCGHGEDLESRKELSVVISAKECRAGFACLTAGIVVGGGSTLDA